MNTEDPMEGTSGLWTTMQDVTPFKPIPNETYFSNLQYSTHFANLIFL